MLKLSPKCGKISINKVNKRRLSNLIKLDKIKKPILTNLLETIVLRRMDYKAK
jgi:hypothetical protein